MSEKGLREEDKVGRVVLGDSWFASFQTAKAMRDELSLYFVGNIKTAHKDFPLEQMRWDLSDTARGDHTVYKLAGENGPRFKCHAVAWNDHHFKTFICTAGSSEAGTQAKRKRHDLDGRTSFKHVKRCKVLQDYYEGCGKIDQHNAHRQGTLKLEKMWKTKKWNARVTVSVLSSCLVDAFLCWERYFPSDGDHELGSNLKSFVAKVIDEIRPDPKQAADDIESCGPQCVHELIGKYKCKVGKNMGKWCTKQERCTICTKNGYRPDRGRAPRTSFRCKYHPDVYVCAAHKRPCLEQHAKDCTSEIHAV